MAGNDDHAGVADAQAAPMIAPAGRNATPQLTDRGDESAKYTAPRCERATDLASWSGSLQTGNDDSWCRFPEQAWASVGTNVANDRSVPGHACSPLFARMSFKLRYQLDVDILQLVVHAGVHAGAPTCSLQHQAVRFQWPSVQNPFDLYRLCTTEDQVWACHTHGPTHACRLNLKITDFDVLAIMGEGSLSTVVKALWRDCQQVYAIKIIDKVYIARKGMLDSVIRERAVMDAVRSDLCVRLCFTFQDAQKLYLGMDLCPNGDLFDQIQARKPLPSAAAQFYAAEIVLILEYLRSARILFRCVRCPAVVLPRSNCVLKYLRSARILSRCARYSAVGLPRSNCVLEYRTTAKYSIPSSFPQDICF